MVALDFIVKLPISQGFDLILTITNQGCTKASIFIPCNEDITAEETAALYIKNVFAHFGLPTKVISNRDPHFMSKFMQAACKATGINHTLSTAYHPRTDRQSERNNQWLEMAIRFITNQKQTNWAPYLPITQFVHNNWPSDTTRKSPFFLLMGFNPRADWVHATSPIPKVTLRLEQLKEAREQAQHFMIKAQQSWVKHRDTPKYKEGDLVWLEGKNLRLNQPTAKLVPRRHGPFKVIQVMSAVNYRLELPMQWSIHPVFHTDLLTPYKETIMHGPNFTRPTPELIDGEEEYTVEKILDSRRFSRQRRLQYLVKWEGYLDSDNMWVDKDDVFADDKLREFKTSNPDAEIHLRRAHVVSTPHLPIHILHHLHHHLICMSSDGRSDLAYEYPAGAVAPSPIPHSAEAADLLEALGHFPRPIPGRVSPDFVLEQCEAKTPTLILPDTRLESTGVRLEGRDGHSPQISAGLTPFIPQRPLSTASDDTAGHCDQCDGPHAYCHCEGPTQVVQADREPSPAPLPIPPQELGTISVNREQAMSLLEDIIGALERDDPAVTISAEEAAKGVDLRATSGQGGVGPDDPPQVSWTSTYQGPVAQAAMRCPPSPIPAGYILNLADNYILFHITDHFGREVLAKYIRVHWGNNPSAQACLTSDGAMYRGEVHAAPHNDHADTPPPLTYEDLRLLQHDNQRKGQVDSAVRRLKDLSVTVLTGKTPDSAVMTTRAGKYH
jgi:hypothetical protein